MSMDEKIQMKFDDFEDLHQSLGAGAAGEVSKMIHKPTNTIVALKVKVDHP